MKNQRKDGRFQKWVTIGKKSDGKPLRKIVYADSMEELEHKATELKKEVVRGEVWADKPTFADMTHAWIEWMQPQRSPSTISTYRSIARRFLLPAVGNNPMTEVTANDIEQILEKLKTDYSYGVRTQVRLMAVRIEEFAMETGVITKPQFNPIPLPGEHKQNEQRTLMDEEISLIISKPTGHSMCIPALIMLFCGLRGTEIRALEWNDIDLKKRTIRVNKGIVNSRYVPTLKEQKERIIPIPATLSKHLRKTTFGEGLVCPNKNGAYMSNGELQVAWVSYYRFLYHKYAARTTKAREHFTRQDFFTTQMVRLSYAKMLFDNGLNLKEIQYLLGYSDLSMTTKLAERFLQMDMERVRDVLIKRDLFG